MQKNQYVLVIKIPYITISLSGQTLPRKGPPLGSCDNPDVIEIEEVAILIC